MSPKKVYKLGEVCSIIGIKSYVLRFWESEFTEIQYTMSSDGHKLYQHDVVEAIAYIKKLLFDNKFTIEKAKQKLVKSGIRKVRGIDFDKNEPTEVDKKPVTDEDRGKIFSARENLEMIVEMTSSIKENHRWN